MNEREQLNELLHSHLCEIMPSVCDNSGQAEWSHSELQKMIDMFMQLTQYWAFRTEKEQLEEMVKHFEFMTGAGRDDVRYAANVIAKLEEKLKRAEEGLEAIVDLHECDPSFNSVDEQSKIEHERFTIAENTLNFIRPNEDDK